MQKYDRNKKHPFEDSGPRQERYVVNDDNWGIAETALPATHPKVSSHRGDERVNTLIHEEAMRPVYDDKSSAYITESHTDGKKA